MRFNRPKMNLSIRFTLIAWFVIVLAPQVLVAQDQLFADSAISS
jgi:hypothetical protein